MEQQAETFKEYIEREMDEAASQIEERLRIEIMEAQGEIF